MTDCLFESRRPCAGQAIDETGARALPAHRAARSVFMGTRRAADLDRALVTA